MGRCLMCLITALQHYGAQIREEILPLPIYCGIFRCKLLVMGAFSSSNCNSVQLSVTKIAVLLPRTITVLVFRDS